MNSLAMEEEMWREGELEIIVRKVSSTAYIQQRVHPVWYHSSENTSLIAKCNKKKSLRTLCGNSSRFRCFHVWGLVTVCAFFVARASTWDNQLRKDCLWLVISEALSNGWLALLLLGQWWGSTEQVWCTERNSREQLLGWWKVWGRGRWRRKEWAMVHSWGQCSPIGPHD